MLDLRQLDVVAAAESGTIVELLHPGTRKPLRDDEQKPYFVEIYSFDASSVRDLEKRFQNKRNEAIRKQKDAGLDVDTLETETVAKLSAATIRWYLPPVDGETLECTHANKKRVYGDPGFVWIAEQLIDAGKDRARFFEKAPSN